VNRCLGIFLMVVVAYGVSPVFCLVVAVVTAVIAALVSRTNGPRTSVAIFAAALRSACALRVLPESAGLDVCSRPSARLARHAHHYLAIFDKGKA
jgi:hypothetical protein